MSNVTPIATRLGFTHVSVAQVSSGDWYAVLWSHKDGPTPLPGDGYYDSAIEKAKYYASRRTGAVLDLPEDFRTIDVLRDDDGGFSVHQHGRFLDNSCLLERFGPHQRDRAISYALGQLGHYAPCRLGRVDT